MTDPRSSIENTLYRYAWAYDIGGDQLPQIAECFTTDAEVEFRDSGWKIGREEVATEMVRRREKYLDGSIPWHVISNVFITDQTETQAVVRSWYTFFVMAADGTQGFRSIGWYDDVFAPQDGAWRVKWRRVCVPSDRPISK